MDQWHQFWPAWTRPIQVAIAALAVAALGFLPALDSSAELPAADKAPRPYVERFAPTSDFLIMGDNWIVGRPNFTGCAPWAIQEIRAENIGGPGDRSKSHWRSDARVIRERPIGDSDYRGNPLGLDEARHPQGVARGHLVNAASQSQCQAAIDATHNAANAVLQDQAFNAQSWERAEQRGRDLATLAAKLGVKARIIEAEIVLFVLEKPADLKTHAWVGTFNAVGENCLWYPSHLAKSLYVTWGKRRWVETYVFENSATVAGDAIEKHLTSVDVIEFQSNLNLWPGIEDEDELESFDGPPPSLASLQQSP